MVAFREHRNSLVASMATARKIDSRADLVELIQATLSPYGVDVAPDQVKVSPYGFDRRIGWDTYVVTVEKYGVFGFTDGPLT